MLLSSVILILQEILEASLIISLLLAYSIQHDISRTWVWYGLGLGIATAALYAANVARVSEWFDYVGLEIINAALQLCISICLFSFAYLRLDVSKVLANRYLRPVMALIVSLAITREGFEIFLYESGFIGDTDLWSPVLIGSLLGAGIGMSLGALIYYSLITLPPLVGLRTLLIFLALFVGNMTAQGVQLLVQADWLPSGLPLWDSSSLLAENSLMGRLLYALVGYEAGPTGLQVSAYLFSFGATLLLFWLRWPTDTNATFGYRYHD